MIVPKYEYSKEVLKKVWNDVHGGKKTPCGKAIKRIRKRNIEKAVKNSSEVKEND